MTFLSEAWFAGIRAVLEVAALEPDSSARLVFDGEGTRWHLVVDDGRVTGWGPGDVADVDAELQWSRADAARIWSGELSGNAALSVTTLVTSASGQPYVGPPAPLDFSRHNRLAALPRMPGATLAAQFSFRRGPFGDVSYALVFVDGQLSEERLETLDDPDVVVEVTYRNMGLLRAGRIGIIEALEGGRIDGEVGPVSMLAGLLESPEFGEVELVTDVADVLALATLGELWADPRFVSARVGLAAGASAS
jgi:hypothetical protein